MAIQLKRTGDVHLSGVKVLTFGLSGAGKTTLIKTLPTPIILSAEAGLLSLKDANLPYIEITSMAELTDAYLWCTQSAEAAEFESIAIDSISEIAEVLLVHEKKIAKDPRQAYGAMQDQIMQLIRSFRDINGKHIYMSAKAEKAQDEMGRMLYSPSMPGNKTGQALPYLFDECFAMRAEKDSEGNTQRALMCHTDGLWMAKDRSGKLDQWEAPDLGAIIRKIGGAS